METIKTLYAKEEKRLAEKHLLNCNFERDHTGEVYYSENDREEAFQRAREDLEGGELVDFLDLVNDSLEDELEAKELLDIINKIAV